MEGSAQICSSCQDLRQRRYCYQLNEKICVHCCNIYRIKYPSLCLKKCSYAPEKKKSEKTGAEMFFISEMTASLYEVKDYIKTYQEIWWQTPLEKLDGNSPCELYNSSQEGKEKVRLFIKENVPLKLPSNNANTDFDYIYNNKLLYEKVGLPIDKKIAQKNFFDFEEVVTEFLKHISWDQVQGAVKKFCVNVPQEELRKLRLVLAESKFKESDLYRSGIQAKEKQSWVWIELEGKNNQLYYWEFKLKLVKNIWKISSFAMLAVEQTSKEAEELFKKASSYFNEGDFHQAMEILHVLVKNYPNNYLFKTRLALAYSAMGELENAYLIIKEVTKDPLLPKSIDAYYILGTILLKKNEFDEAEQAFNKQLEILPQHLATLNNLGNICLVKNKEKEALNYWSRALQIDPSYSPAMNNMLVYQMQAEK